MKNSSIILIRAEAGYHPGDPVAILAGDQSNHLPPSIHSPPRPGLSSRAVQVSLAQYWAGILCGVAKQLLVQVGISFAWCMFLTRKCYLLNGRQYRFPLTWLWSWSCSLFCVCQESWVDWGTNLDKNKSPALHFFIVKIDPQLQQKEQMK